MVDGDLKLPELTIRMLLAGNSEQRKFTALLPVVPHSYCSCCFTRNCLHTIIASSCSRRSRPSTQRATRGTRINCPSLPASISPMTWTSEWIWKAKGSKRRVLMTRRLPSVLTSVAVEVTALWRTNLQKDTKRKRTRDSDKDIEHLEESISIDTQLIWFKKPFQLLDISISMKRFATLTRQSFTFYRHNVYPWDLRNFAFVKRVLLIIPMGVFVVPPMKNVWYMCSRKEQKADMERFFF